MGLYIALEFDEGIDQFIPILDKNGFLRFFMSEDEAIGYCESELMTSKYEIYSLKHRSYVEGVEASENNDVSF